MMPPPLTLAPMMWSSHAQVCTWVVVPLEILGNKDARLSFSPTHKINFIARNEPVYEAIVLHMQFWASGGQFWVSYDHFVA